MVIEEDYLLGQIHQLVRAVVQAKEREDEYAVKEAITDGLRRLCGLSADTLCRMSPDAIAPMVTLDGQLESDRAQAIAALLLEDAKLQSDPGVRHARRVAALGLLALVGAEGGAALAHLDGVVRSVHLTSLHPTTLARLIGTYEAADRYDRADDLVFAWVGVDVDAAFDAGMALYERLWGLPDARLRAGGLSTDEVLESMAELQRRAGRK